MVSSKRDSVRTYEHKTSTSEILNSFESSENPVTRGVYRDILSNRLGIAERRDFVESLNNKSLLKHMRSLTYSFDSRKRMENYLEKTT